MCYNIQKPSAHSILKGTVSAWKTSNIFCPRLLGISRQIYIPTVPFPMAKSPPKNFKKTYKELGYQILAITDHNVIVDHSNMTEPDFLMLTGVEIDLNHESYRPGFDGKTYHLNLISKRPDNLWVPNKATHYFHGCKEYLDSMQCEHMDLCHDPESVNKMIAKANEMGFIVMYNHPTWSCQSYPDYAPLKGFWGIELRNSACCELGNNENNARVFKDLLNLGNRLYPMGADDTHNPAELGQSWLMVGAQTLEYSCVMEALEKGDFYMSCGPQIFSLTIQENVLKITCSDAQYITLESHGRFARRAAANGNAWIQEAKFDLTDFISKADGDTNAYIHLTVTAPDGTYAATRAYYAEEL